MIDWIKRLWRPRLSAADLLTRYVKKYQAIGDAGAATGSNEFAGAPPCICHECQLYRVATNLLNKFETDEREATEWIERMLDGATRCEVSTDG